MQRHRLRPRGKAGEAVKGAVFIGPSLETEVAREMLQGMEVEFHPPVRRGDLPCLGEDVEVVAIIDGVFHGESSVGHREITALLKRGVKVIGGSSMGALRAYELKDLGMQGYGIVYAMYDSGLVDGDDEVALVFDPETLEPLSEPLVNTRYLLQKAEERGILSAEEGRALLAALKKEFYPRRSRALLLLLAEKQIGKARAAALEIMTKDMNFDAKRCDAAVVLNRMRMLLEATS
jgi:hypothetical protein